MFRKRQKYWRDSCSPWSKPTMIFCSKPCPLCIGTVPWAPPSKWHLRISIGKDIKKKLILNHESTFSTKKDILKNVKKKKEFTSFPSFASFSHKRWTVTLYHLNKRQEDKSSIYSTKYLAWRLNIHFGKWNFRNSWTILHTFSPASTLILFCKAWIFQ